MNRKRIEPGPGQESVWDYPRPPACEPTKKTIKAVVDGIVLVETTGAYRVLETSHPPVYYFPRQDVRMDLMKPDRGGSFCEWKGHAHYLAIELPNRRLENAAWYYPTPTQRFDAIAGYLAFYPSKLDACYVNEEQARAQVGDFYGGWITDDLVGPFKGAPGTMGW